MADTLVLKTPGTLTAPVFGRVPNLLWQFKASALTQAADTRVTSWASSGGSMPITLNQASTVAPIIRDISRGRTVRFASQDSARIGTSNFAAPVGVPLTMYAVVQRLATGTGLGTIWSGGSGGYLSATYGDGTGSINAGAGTSAYELAGPVTPEAVPCLVAVVYNGSNSSITVNDVTVKGALGNANPDAAKLPRLTVGANSGWNSNFLNAYVYEIGAFANVYSEGDLRSLYQAKATEYGF